MVMVVLSTAPYRNRLRVEQIHVKRIDITNERFVCDRFRSLNNQSNNQNVLTFKSIYILSDFVIVNLVGRDDLYVSARYRCKFSVL